MLRFPNPSPLLAFAVASLGTSIVHCAPPTEIRVTVVADEENCLSTLTTAVRTAGTLATANEGSGGLFTTANGCGGGRVPNVGTVVVVPSHNGDRVAIVVRAHPNPLAEPTRQIIARRDLPFVTGTSLNLRVDLRKGCEGNPCPNVEQTCVAPTGTPKCRSATVNVDACKDGECTEALLPPAVGWPSDCGTMAAFEADSPWPMEGGCPSRRRRSPLALSAMPTRVAWLTPVGNVYDGMGGKVSLGELLVAANGDVVAMEATPGAVTIHRLRPNGTERTSPPMRGRMSQGNGYLDRDRSMVVPANDTLVRFNSVSGLATFDVVANTAAATFTGGIAVDPLSNGATRYVPGVAAGKPALFRIAGTAVLPGTSVAIPIPFQQPPDERADGSVPLVLPNGDVVVGTQFRVERIVGTTVSAFQPAAVSTDLRRSVFGRGSDDALIGWYPLSNSPGGIYFVGPGPFQAGRSTQQRTAIGPAIADDNTVFTCVPGVGVLHFAAGVPGLPLETFQATSGECSQITLDAEGRVLVAVGAMFYVLDPIDISRPALATVALPELVINGSSIVIAPNNRVYVRTFQSVVALDP